MAIDVKQPEYLQDETLEYVRHGQEALLKAMQQWTKTWFDFSDQLLAWQREYTDSLIKAAALYISKETPKPAPYPTTIP